MRPLDHLSLPDALAAVGAELARQSGPGRVRIVIAGSTAGLLARLLKAARVTGDCDVIWLGDEPTWTRIESAAATVARDLDLPSNWLNRSVSMWAWCLPLGWSERCEHVGTFDALDVFRIGRIDLIAAKVMSSPRRPHDLEDLRDLKVTREKLSFVEQHIGRLQAEDLDRREFADQRAILQSLRGGA